MSGVHAGNQHKAHSCWYCPLVVYSKGALTRHENEEHWREKEAEEALEKELANEPA